MPVPRILLPPFLGPAPDEDGVTGGRGPGGRMAHPQSPRSFGGKKPPWRHLVQGALWTLALLLFLVLQVSPLVNRVTEDESMLVYDAHRVSQGQVPYRDFFGLWAPGGYFVFSGGSWGWWSRPETGCRYLQVGVILLFTVLLARVFRPWGRWAWPLSALFPVALFPQCAFMGNHWFAVMAYMGAVLLADWLREAPDMPWAWGALGALAALAGWFLQTQGFLAVILVLLTVLFVGRRPAGNLPGKAARAVGGALAATVLLLAPLFIAGAGKGLLRDAVLWPLANYRKPGNVADVPLLDGFSDRIAALFIRPDGVGGLVWIMVAVAGGVLFLALLLGFALLCAASLRNLARVSARHEAFTPGKTTASVLTLLALLLFWRVNPAWVHFIYALAPVLLLWCFVPPKNWHERWRKVYGPALSFLLACAVLYHGRSYLEAPHAGWEYLDVDRVDRESPLNQSLRALPFMGAGDTIAVLPSGGDNYLYTYPAAVGYTQLFVLELDHHTLEDHERAAGEIARRRPKLVLLHAVNEASFMAPGDPISKVVRQGYERWTRTPSVVVYLRKDVLTAVQPKPLPGVDGSLR
jgi:hypothetical protein